MATSGSKTVSIYSWISLKFAWTQASQSIANNTTTINWTLSATTTSAGAVYKKNRTWTVTIDGTKYTGTVNVSLDKSSTQTLASGTATINHNGDGTKTFAYAFSQQFELTLNSGKYMSTYSGSGADTLTTIPRKSSLTVGHGTLGTSQTITVTQKSSSFTHSIKAVCGSSTLYIKADGTTSATEVKHNDCSIPWTPPIGWAAQAPNDNSVLVTFTITTYNGSTNIGSTPTSVAYAIPDIDSLKPSIVPAITDATGYDKLLGGWVQGQSQVKVDVESYGVYGSTIKSIKTEFEGNTYTGASITTNAITGYDVLPITITVTDTRDRSRTVKPEIFVQKYAFPKITKLTAKRCNSDGTLNAAGDHIRVSFGAEITSLNNNNTAKYYVGYKKVSEANHKAVELSDLSGQYVVDSYYVVPAETASSYTIIFNALDSIKSDGTRLTIDVPSAKQVWSLLKKNGDIVGIAFNKVAEHEGYFDIGMPVLFSGGGDIVVERGEKDGWTYRKWQSGVAECWKTVAHTTKVNTPWGNLYVGTTPIPRQNYPIVFAAKPVENVSLTSGGSMGMIYPEQSGYGVNGAYATAMYNICCLGSVTTDATYYVSYMIKGKWK
jgi:hypothetical protein